MAEQDKTNNKPRKSAWKLILEIVALIAGLATIISLVIMIYDRYKPKEVQDTPTITNEQIADNAETYSRIVNLHEAEEGKYTHLYYQAIILEDPVIGDMLAQVLNEVPGLGETCEWIPEFISKTDDAMSLPENYHPRGIEIWLWEQGGGYYTTKEYQP